MGLDIAEVILECEERFGVPIPDRVAERLVTPADILDHVAASVRLVRASACLTQHTFYRLRRGLRAAGVEAPVLRPGTRLDSLASGRTCPLSGAGRAGKRVPRTGRARWIGAARSPAGRQRWATSAASRRCTCPRTEPAAWRGWTRERLELALRRALWEAARVPRFELRDHLVRDLGLG